MTQPNHVGEVRDLVVEALEKTVYAVRDVEILERSDEVRELSASLVSISVEPAELDAVVGSLEASPLVSHSSGSSSIEE